MVNPRENLVYKNGQTLKIIITIVNLWLCMPIVGEFWNEGANGVLTVQAVECVLCSPVNMNEHRYIYFLCFSSECAEQITLFFWKMATYDTFHGREQRML